LLTNPWDWYIDDQTRAFAKQFYEKTKIYSAEIQADDYAATLTYLNAVKTAGTTNTDQVMVKLKSMPIYDFNTKGFIRSDDCFVHDVYLMQVKTAAESKDPWNYFKDADKLSDDEVFIIKAEGHCKL
jgi:branched-chain amino acid transport system substrate-binding protein